MLAWVVGDSVVLQGFGELLGVQAARTVVVDDLKRLSNADNASSTAGLDLVANALDQLVV